jgi:predicted DNA-binding transcriptional regulator YafY
VVLSIVVCPVRAQALVRRGQLLTPSRGIIGAVPHTSARLLSLLSLLQARRDWPGSLLAERLDVSPRTVRRDVDRLRELGYPVQAVKGPDGGYRLDAGTELPPLLFDDEQAVALAVALQIAVTSGAGIEDTALRALTTVRQIMPARLRHRIDALQVTAVDRGGTRPAPQVDSAVLVTLGAAVRAREVLRFDYDTASPNGASRDDRSAAPPRRVQPHHLVTRGGRWYLVAWDLDRDDWRTFRADRIIPHTPTGPRFVPRDVPGGARWRHSWPAGSKARTDRPLGPAEARSSSPSPPPTCRRTPATGSSRNSARTAAGSSSDRGHGWDWPPPSAGSTPTSRSSARAS